MPVCCAMAAPAPATATTVSPSRSFLIMHFLLLGKSSSACAALEASAPSLYLSLDSVKARGNPALEQRPVETQRQRDIAARDHLVGLFGRAGDAADRHAAFEDAGLGARHQLQHLRIIGQAAPSARRAYRPLP